MEQINKLNYWSDEQHKKWKVHYFEGNYKDDYFLAFTKEWADLNLPSRRDSHNSLWCKLLDTESNIIYEMSIYAAYEDVEVNSYYMDYEDFSDIMIKHMKLQSYFYEEHHCPCHRHTDAVNSGLKENDGVDDFECQGDRFQIQSIIPKGSDLILYSETMSMEELEEALNGHQK